MLWSIILATHLYVVIECASDKNVALKKPAYQSSTWSYGGYSSKFKASADLAVDGNYDAKVMNRHCSHTYDSSGNQTWLVVDLQHQYHINHVVVTNRKDCCGHRLNNFIVGLTNIFSPTDMNPTKGFYSTCGQYPGNTNEGGKYTVPCMEGVPSARYVIIRQEEKGDGKLTVCELEVYAEYREHFVGHYQNVSNETKDRVVLDGQGTVTAEKCISKCRELETTYAGIKNDECFCGEDFTNALSIVKCSNDTSDQICEKKHVASRREIFYVYAVCPIGYYGRSCLDTCNCKNQTPCHITTGECRNGCEDGWTGISCNTERLFNQTQYLGCYKDYTQPIRDLPFMGVNRTTWPRINITIERCTSICRLKGYAYAGMQHWYECLCGNRYGSYGKLTDELCNNTCSGNPAQICGGVRINSVYSVCPKGTFGFNCTQTCHCADDSTCSPFNGSCSDGGCKKGWMGDKCNIRNCSTANGGCDGNEECQSVVLSHANVTRCVCEDGYYRHQVWDPCTEVLHAISSADSVSQSNAVTTILLALLAIATVAVIIIAGAVLVRRRPKNVSGVGFAVAEKIGLHQQSNNEGTNDIYANVGSNCCPTKLSKTELLKYIANNSNHLEAEFERIPVQTKASCTYGKSKQLKKKNRFQNIIPYDQNRVILSVPGADRLSDYINASYITGYNSEKFIATQAPNERTLDDFWRMLCEQDVRVVVMLCNENENGKTKCQRYWPTCETGQEETGSTTVTLESEQFWPSFCCRRLSTSYLKNNYQYLTKVTQWHFTSWPDHGVPTNVASFLSFRRKVRQSMVDNTFTVVHCSAGVGRTGCFLAVDYLLQELKAENCVDVQGCVRTLREERPQMIQTLVQYQFVYSSLEAEITIGDTTYSKVDFLKKMKWLQQISVNGRTRLETQFNYLLANSSTPTDQINSGTTKAKHRERRNKDDGGLQPILLPRFSDAEYLVCGLPDSMTAEELWNSFLSNSGTIVFIGDKQDRDSYFDGRSLNLNDATLTFLESRERCYGTSNKVEISQRTGGVDDNAIYANTSSTPNVSMKSVFYVRCSDVESVEYDTIQALFHDLSSTRSESMKPVLVFCKSDWFGFCGFVVAAMVSFGMLKSHNEVDIYQISHELRRIREELMQTLNSFTKLHDVVARHVSNLTDQ